jgi:hypothetical protein
VEAQRNLPQSGIDRSLTFALSPAKTGKIYAAMSTLDQAGLVQLLKQLSISTPIPQVMNAVVLSNPLDLCRTTLAELLSGLVDCNLETAYRSIQWPNNIYQGDLSVTVPKLCPGRKPAELSSQLIDKVRLKQQTVRELAN